MSETKIERVTKAMRIGDILHQYPTSSNFLLENGMHCLGCPSSLNESLDEACLIHGLDADDIVNRLNQNITEGRYE